MFYRFESNNMVIEKTEKKMLQMWGVVGWRFNGEEV